ncbi:MAG: hypothetical protein QXR44_02385 [Thermoproteota archaeon]
MWRKNYTQLILLILVILVSIIAFAILSMRKTPVSREVGYSPSPPPPPPSLSLSPTVSRCYLGEFGYLWSYLFLGDEILKLKNAFIRQVFYPYYDFWGLWVLSTWPRSSRRLFSPEVWKNLETVLRREFLMFQ